MNFLTQYPFIIYDTGKKVHTYTYLICQIHCQS